MAKLKKFLKKHNACSGGYIFAKDLTLEEALKNCPRGDWILWLFEKNNPNSLKEITLAKGHCAATVLHLMIDDRSKKAVQSAIDFGEGKSDSKELTAAYAAANAASDDASDAAYAAYSAAAYAYAAARKLSQKQTANICRKYLPIEIWDK